MRRLFNRDTRAKDSLRSSILLVFAATWFIVVVILAGVAVRTQIQAAQINGVQSALSRIALANNTVELTARNVDLIGIRLVNSSVVRALCDREFVKKSDEDRRMTELMMRSLLYEDAFVIHPGHRVTLMLACGDGRIYTNLEGVFSQKADDRTRRLADQLSSLPDGSAPYLLDVAPESELLPDVNSLVYRRRFSTVSGADASSELYILVRNADFLNEIRYDGIVPNNYAVMDDGGKILISDQPEWIGRDTQQLFGLAHNALEGQNHYQTASGGHLLVYERKAGSRFTGIQLLSRSEFIESARRIVVLVVLMAIVFLGLFFALSYYLSQRLTAPLRKLGEKMYQTAGGDMNVRFEPRFNDEIGLIGHQFDSMVVRLRESMEQLRESERKKRSAELRALEMQINPHFLYNTLSTIVWLASEEKNEEVIDITKQLSCYLRQSLSDGREFIPVKDEIGHVRSYIRIQSTRYGDILKCYFDIQPEAESILMPKLMLQPLVENAIYHGVKERRDKDGVICVCARLEDHELRLEVWDNGNIDQTRCDQLNDALRGGESIGIGTSTINNRLKLYYPGRATLRFRRQDCWTIAAIRIPETGGTDLYDTLDRG
ncbi:MAG: sensor histidine kinase [Clostridia bacterium]|nr:sensor histidine kinase [Clostridia bacterium]